MGWTLGSAVGIPTFSNTIGSVASSYMRPAIPTPALPVYGSRPAGGYAPIPAPNIPKMEYKPLVSGGVNPGLLTLPGPDYKTTDPREATYYWGSRPYIETMNDIGKLRDPAVIGTKGWSPAPQKEIDVNAFIRDLNKTNFISTPAQNTAIGKPALSPATKYPSIPGYAAVNTTTRK